MRRAVNGFVALLGSFMLLAGLSLPGCGGSGEGGDPGGDRGGEIDEPQLPSGMLRPVRDAAEFEQTLKDALAEVIDQGLPNGPVTFPTTTSADFSGTYTVQAGVDELDFVRYDGNHLFIAPKQFGLPASETAIRILRTDPASATAAQVGSIPLDSSQNILGMYVADERMFLVTSDAYFGPYGDLWPTVLLWVSPKFTVEVHDIRDPAHPRRLLAATIDGMFVESRRVDDRVVIVSRHAPHVLLDAAQRQRLAQLPLAELLPAMTLNGRRQELVDPRRCYVTSDRRGEGHAVLTTITTFSLANPLDIDGICYDEPANGVYASRDALYVSEPRYAAGYASSTRIHKFSLRGARPRYSGSVEVPGMVWTGGQADFRMNESDGMLRVVTTELTGDPGDFTDHRLFVLRQKTDEAALEILGRLPNDSHPEEIGKPNEDLFGVRFDGDRAFAVTFQRVDPLYVIDLSTPSDPRIAGQLLLPGFSDFLHPVSDDLLLGLGMNAGRFKLELFDTSVLENPQSRGAITLGVYRSDSPATYDRHTFAYLAGEATDRFALPATIVTGQPGVDFGVDTSLHQFEVLGKDTPASASLLEAGVVSTPKVDQTNPGFHRAFINGGAVFYVRDGQVWGSFWSSPSQVNGPF
jgi:beta propeller domain-containing protein